MIPSDSEDHYKEYQILLNELEEYNPELIDKDIIVSISKSDLDLMSIIIGIDPGMSIMAKSTMKAASISIRFRCICLLFVQI